MEQLLLNLILLINVLLVAMAFAAGVICLVTGRRPPTGRFYHCSGAIVLLYACGIGLLLSESTGVVSLAVLKISMHLILWSAAFYGLGLAELLSQAAVEKKAARLDA